MSETSPPKAEFKSGHSTVAGESSAEEALQQRTLELDCRTGTMVN